MNRAFRFCPAAFVGLSALVLLAGCGTGRLGPGGFSTVVIDAGHGGKESGARSRGRGLNEKDVALDTARRLQSLLRREGFRTVMTRSDDRFVELDDRVLIANRYGPRAILVSIHYNSSGNSGPRGLETYYWRSDSYGLAVRVQRHLISETDEPHHGVIRRVLRLTRNPQIPSILCEAGYLSNPTDAALIATSDYRQSVAEGIADGIVEERERGDVDIGPLPKKDAVVLVRPASRHGVTSRRHGRSSSRGSRSASTSKRTTKKQTTTKKKKRSR